MQSDLGRKNDELFRRVVISAYRACAKRGEAAARALLDELRTHTLPASEHIVGHEAIQAAEMRGGTIPSQKSIEVSGKIVFWNGHAVDCTLGDCSCSGARLKV